MSPDNADIFLFKISEDNLYMSFKESDLIDFNQEDFLNFDNGNPVYLKAKNVTFRQGEEIDFKESLDFGFSFIRHKGEAVALSKGGWRMLGFIPNNSHLLFDKNSLNVIKENIDDGGAIRASANKAVAEMFVNRNIVVDPKPLLLEGNNRQRKTLPDIHEMAKELNFFNSKMMRRLPNSKLGVSEGALAKLYAKGAGFFEGIDAITTFIEDIHITFSSNKSMQPTLENFKEVIEKAKRNSLKRDHLIFGVIAFKAITGKRNNSLQKMMKFNMPNYIAQGYSYNAALDIYSIFLFISELRDKKRKNVFFVTADKDLIYFWNNINPYLFLDNVPGSLSIDMQYFLPGLSEPEIGELKAVMSSY